MEGLINLRESKCRLAAKKPENPIKKYVQSFTQAVPHTNLPVEPDETRNIFQTNKAMFVNIYSGKRAIRNKPIKG